MAIHFLESAALTELPAAKKLVLMAFADSADKDSRVAIPGFDSLLRWSGLGRSQAYDVIAELVELGFIARRSAGRAGRRAEFVVFPRGGCCPLHQALPEFAVEDDVAEPAEDPSNAGSGQPDPAQTVDDAVDNPTAQPSTTTQGSGSGSGSGSGLDRTPSRLPGYEQPPNPPEDRGAKSRCRRHQDTPGPNCRRCGTSPRGAEQQEHQVAADAAADTVARIERERAELPRCGHRDCGPDRWRSPDVGAAHRCPDCHPDLVIGRPTPAQLELARFAQPR